MEIWDTAGEEKFQALTPMYSRDAAGAFIVFDVTSRVTFDHLNVWKDILVGSASDLALIVVGNKADLESRREVSPEEATDYALSINAEYAETSAATGQGVVESFAMLSAKAIQLGQQRMAGLALDVMLSPPEKRRGCC
jgi:small GTP-binding protein